MQIRYSACMAPTPQSDALERARKRVAAELLDEEQGRFGLADDEQVARVLQVLRDVLDEARLRVDTDALDAAIDTDRLGSVKVTSVRVPGDLHGAASRAARSQGLTIQQWVTTALAEALLRDLDIATAFAFDTASDVRAALQDARQDGSLARELAHIGEREPDLADR